MAVYQPGYLQMNAHEDLLLMQLGLKPIPKELYEKREVFHVEHPPILEPVAAANLKPVLDSNVSPEPVLEPEAVLEPLFVPIPLVNLDKYAVPFQAKVCANCSKHFYRKKRLSEFQWIESKYCSVWCSRSRKGLDPNTGMPLEPSFRITPERRKALTDDILSIIKNGTESTIQIYNELIRLGRLPMKDDRYMSEHSIYRLVKGMRLRLERPRPDSKAAKILKMLHEDIPTPVIAQELKCSIAYVHCCLHRRNLTLEIIKEEMKRDKEKK